MSTLLDILSLKSAAGGCGRAELRKTSSDAVSESAMVAESCGMIEINPQSPQMLRMLKPAPDRVFHKSANPQGVNSLNKSSPQDRLVNLTRSFGVSYGFLLDGPEISALVPPSDWNDVDRCSPEELQGWASMLASRAIRYRGKVPDGWTKIALCASCGPVWSFAAGECLVCPWCEVRRAGRFFPVPV